MSSSSLRLAIDIGGTFTDTVLADAKDNILASTKTPTTPTDPTEGALDGIRHVLETSGRSGEEIGLFIHGTTLATNALIERRGATVSTITTEECWKVDSGLQSDNSPTCNVLSACFAELTIVLSMLRFTHTDSYGAIKTARIGGGENWGGVKFTIA